ncbi:MAG: hypothetical protein A2Y33_00830 [Spirochaetes bacterium GWF1_51_8]|nr:MAG: hypothetical protein A2Y33_00830 [Spirochaetes bacterium GWF1_51_8]
MPFVEWKDELSVGVQSIDAQHKNLLGIINELHDAMQHGKGKDALFSVFEKMSQYADEHFTYEEKILTDHNYPLLAGQKAQHEEFTRKAEEFKEGFDSGRALISVSVLDFLRDWWVSHIAQSDKKYASFLEGKDVK